MLSPKIDLTEHRDFGGTRFAFTGFHPLVERWFDDGNISMDEYDYMCWFEGIFGKFRHKNEKNKVFVVLILMTYQKLILFLLHF